MTWFDVIILLSQCLGETFNVTRHFLDESQLGAATDRSQNCIKILNLDQRKYGSEMDYGWNGFRWLFLIFGYDFSYDIYL